MTLLSRINMPDSIQRFIMQSHDLRQLNLLNYRDLSLVPRLSPAGLKLHSSKEKLQE
ncbi:MAG: hypothetical protein ACI9GW_000185 [Halieaceae bacterium]|jgi:hypothetical protein